mmetsp:Transcript_1874/g.2289  ORF Transcript_1874/g.2289 Transcript_1874/m.2289 type:complete len:144 (-) Transcript_1874:189-620(-)
MKKSNTHTAKEIQSKDRNCVPCESLDNSTLLKQNDVKDVLSIKLLMWTIHPDQNKISRKFTAKTFQCAIDFLNAVGNIAEREGHHPDLHLTSYRDVEVTLYTHSIGGLTKNDLKLAEMIDTEIKVCYSPKWLKEHPEATVTSM